MADYNSNAELVAIAWLKSLAAVPSDKVGSDLPAIETAQWGATGFLQVTPVGGSTDVWIPRRRPVIQVACWAYNAKNPSKLPYAKSNQLAEIIVRATEERENFGLELSMPTGFAAIRIMGVRVESEPRRINDPSQYARTDLDISVDWMQTEQVTT